MTRSFLRNALSFVFSGGRLWMLPILIILIIASVPLGRAPPRRF